MVSAAASGGGRELLPREQAVAFPVSSTTDHLGALLMAPLNIAWLLQAWTLLGATAYAVGPRPDPAARADAGAGLAGRGDGARPGRGLVGGVGPARDRAGPRRRGASALALGLALLIVTDTLVVVLDRSPTVRILLGALRRAPAWSRWEESSWCCSRSPWSPSGRRGGGGAVVRRPARDELRGETSRARPGRTPPATWSRCCAPTGPAIWRSVPLRRGLAVLGLLPGLVALAGGLRLGDARHHAGPGRLRRCAAVRGQLVVPGRSRRAVA